MIKNLIKHIKNWFEDYDDYSIPNEDFNKSDIINGNDNSAISKDNDSSIINENTNESTNCNEVIAESEDPFIDFSADDIISYKEENGIVYAYLNQKALDIALYILAKEKLKDITRLEQWYRKIEINDIIKTKHIVTHKPYEDGDYITKGDVIILLGLDYSALRDHYIEEVIYGSWLNYGIKIYSRYDGYIANIIKNSDKIDYGDIIQDGDLLFTIKSETKPEEDNLSKKEVHFTYSMLTKEFLDSIPYLSSIQIQGWLVDNFNIVNKGDDILTVKEAYSKNNNICTLKSPYSGIIKIREFNLYDRIKKGSYLFTIYSNDASLIENYPNEIIVTKDDFTNEVIIRSEKCAGNSLGFDIGSWDIKDEIYMNFEYIGGKYYLLLKYDRRGMTLNKKCSFQLLLGDNSVIVLNAVANPVKVYNTELIIKFHLSKEDIMKLENEKFVKWQIINEEGLAINSDETNCFFNPHNRTNGHIKELSYVLFQNFIKEFNKVVEDNISEDMPIKVIDKDTKVKSTCYVYLMIDTSNNFHKIGISNSPKYREHTLQSDKPTIELLCAKEYPSRAIAEAIETALHNTFANKRIRGEWFKLSSSDIDDIKQTLT